MRKCYYQCSFRQAAPLRLSNGENDRTDNDLMLDGNGMPFIPGSAIAGVLRSMLPEKEGNRLFGWIEQEAEKEQSAHESMIQISDGILRLEEDSRVHRTVRHGVGINDEGVAEDRRKYDFDVVETDSKYVSVLELTLPGESDPAEEATDSLMCQITAQGISFGARTSRGYGNMTVSVRKRCFSLDRRSGPGGTEEWLSFDPFMPETFDGEPISGVEAIETDGIIYKVGLRMTGSFSVRVYSSNPERSDYAPLTSMEGKPVLPGTGWAGVFRHHMRRLAGEACMPAEISEKIDRLFGVCEEEHLKSRIRFSETVIEGGKPLDVTRVALDRFTMKPRQRALFFSTLWQDGSGTLEIRIAGEPDVTVKSLLEATLLDLHFGLLNIGGEGNVGRGRAEITGLEISGRPVDQLLGVEICAREAIS